MDAFPRMLVQSAADLCRLPAQAVQQLPGSSYGSIVLQTRIVGIIVFNSAVDTMRSAARQNGLQ
jgi:hypothetical protein